MREYGGPLQLQRRAARTTGTIRMSSDSQAATATEAYFSIC
ncbi:hypothetical protein AWB83_05367 [Caballeronia ptereochthonis]|uniref:Uncharacterized protein n=1 Tax=Caballeronia ptereochthonis TaxID=1777144 RepID=A0A158DE49_9BURK|nr:hypothetical protein AWB83_05367 [Caballeronia ptereochthonis]